MAEHIEIAKAFITVVPTLSGAQEELTRELTGATVTASEKAGDEGGSKFSEKFASVVKGAGVAIGAALTAATGAAIATGKAFLNTANDVSAMGDAIGDNAAKMGVSTKFYQEYDFILQRAGSSIDSLKTSMKTLANAAVNGSEAFDALGISQEEVAKLSQEELFDRTVKALQGVEDTTTRTALASKLLGKGALEMGAVFNMTASEMEDAKEEMYALGAYMDEDAIAASDNYQDTMANLQDSIKGLKIGVIKDFMPGITSVMDGMSKVFSGRGGVEQIQEGLTSVISNTTSMAPQFFSLASVIVTSLLNGFAPMAPQLVSSIFGFLEQGILTIAQLTPQLTPVITEGVRGIASALFTCLPVLISALIDMVSELVTWLSSNDNVKDFIDGILRLVDLIVNKFGELLPILLPAVVNIVGQVAASLVEPKNINMILQSTLYIIGAVAVAIVKAIPELLSALGRVFTSIGSGVLSFQRETFSKLSTWFADVIGKVGTFATGVINKIKTLPSQVLTIGKNLVTGLWNGINDKSSWVKQKISNMGSQITSAIKKVFGIASPSKVWKKEIGAMLALGIGEGFTNEMDVVKDDMADSMSNLTGNMSASVTAYGSQGAAMYDAVSGNTYNGGAVTINVYGAEGQSANELARQIGIELENIRRREGAVYA